MRCGSDGSAARGAWLAPQALHRIAHARKRPFARYVHGTYKGGLAAPGWYPGCGR